MLHTEFNSNPRLVLLEIIFCYEDVNNRCKKIQVQSFCPFVARISVNSMLIVHRMMIVDSRKSNTSPKNWYSWLECEEIACEECQHLLTSIQVAMLFCWGTWLR